MVQLRSISSQSPFQSSLSVNHYFECCIISRKITSILTSLDLDFEVMIIIDKVTFIFELMFDCCPFQITANLFLSYL